MTAADPSGPLDGDDPLAALRADRARARERDDAVADLCTLATAGADGPAVRTLVLRDVDGDFALFVNDSSAKWRELDADPRFELAVWLPSLQRQWRLAGRTRALPDAIVARHWARRPRVAQLTDHLFDAGPGQGEAVDDPATLDALREALDEALPDPTPPARSARALRLEVERAECLQIEAAPRPHRRVRWLRDADAWRRIHLAP